MHWFAPSQRGLALGIRQSSVPIGGFVAAIGLPPLADAKGLTWTFAALGVACALAALAGALLLRSPARPVVARPVRPRAARRTLRRPTLWLVSCGSALFLFAQTATMSFTVLFLSDDRGMSPHAAALSSPRCRCSASGSGSRSASAPIASAPASSRSRASRS